MAPSLAQLIDRAASTAARVDRRGFLRRTAVVGSALAVHPVRYVARPMTAYAAICNCSGSSCDCAAQCCDGYTEFCCTMTGRNQCPPGTIVAGWWKVDGASLCGGAPRYYLDCNAGCGDCGCGGSGLCNGSCSGTPCECGNGSCGNRKSGCTIFRYGQCNQATACVGPIVCRVVTCTPPWQIDATCTTTVRVDDATRFHDAPCLHPVPFGNVDSVQLQPGRATIQGWVADPDTAAPIYAHLYVNGSFAAEVLASVRRPDVGAAYPNLGPNHGFTFTLPLPTGTHNLCVYGINVGDGSVNPAIGCRTVGVGGPPFGSLDSAFAGPGRMTVQGWTIDPDTAGPIDVHVYVDGRFAGAGTAADPRSDVAAAFPGYGARHGFSLTVAASPGAHEVCAFAINVGGSINPSLGCRSLVVGGPPVGNLDAAGGGQSVITLEGWALDPDTLAPVEVHVYVDGTFAGWGLADGSRLDVAAAFPAFGDRHGFSIAVPAASGSHTVCAYAINVGGSVNPSLGCRAVVVR